MSEKDTEGRSKRPGGEHESASRRKDRVIQTRVPEDLESALKEKARKERVTVSHLIRNLLENTFELVDDVVRESAQITETVRRDARRIAQSAQAFRGRTGSAAPPGISEPTAPAPLGAAKEALLDRVDAWQEVRLNRQASCTKCGKDLAKGQSGLRGLSDRPLPNPVWLCGSCGADL